MSFWDINKKIIDLARGIEERASLIVKDPKSSLDNLKNIEDYAEQVLEEVDIARNSLKNKQI